jgi:hypothetical protein
MKRSLQDWASLAEIIGTAAIVLSLIFVGLQMSNNTREMRSAAAHNATQSLQELYIDISSNPEVAHVFRIGMSDPNALSKDEAFVYRLKSHSAMLTYQNVFFLGTEGALDASLHLTLIKTLGAIVPTPGFDWYWRQRADYFTPEFRVFVEELLISEGASTGGEIYR